MVPVRRVGADPVVVRKEAASVSSAKAAQQKQPFVAPNAIAPVAAPKDVANAAPTLPEQAAAPTTEELQTAVAKLEAVPAVSGTVSLHDWLEGYRTAALHPKDGRYPKGVNHEAYDLGRALALRGFTERELLLYIVYGESQPEVAARLGKVSKLLNETGEWTAQNSLTALIELRVATLRAIGGLDESTEEQRATIQTTITEIESEKHTLFSSGNRARLRFGLSDLADADDFDQKAARERDPAKAQALRDRATRARERGKETLLHASKHFESFIAPLEKAGKPIPKWLQGMYGQALDGRAHAGTVEAKAEIALIRDGDQKAPLKLELPGALREANTLLDRSAQVNKGAATDQSHLQARQEALSAAGDYHKIAIERGDFTHAAKYREARDAKKTVVATRIGLLPATNKLDVEGALMSASLHGELGDIRAEEARDHSRALQLEQAAKHAEDASAALAKSTSDVDASLTAADDNVKELGGHFGTERVRHDELDANLNLSLETAGDVQVTAAQDQRAAVNVQRNVLATQRDAAATFATTMKTKAEEARLLAGPKTSNEAAEVAVAVAEAHTQYTTADGAYSAAEQKAKSKSKLAAAIKDTHAIFRYDYAARLGETSSYTPLDPKVKAERKSEADEALRLADRQRLEHAQGSDLRVSMSQASAVAHASMTENFADVDAPSAVTHFETGRAIVASEIRPYDKARANVTDARLGEAALNAVDVLDSRIVGLAADGKVTKEWLWSGDKLLAGAAAVSETVGKTSELGAPLAKRVQTWNDELAKVPQVFAASTAQSDNGAALAVAQGATITDSTKEMADASYNEIGRGWFMIGSGIFHAGEALVKWDSDELEIDDPQGEKQADAENRNGALHQSALVNRNVRRTLDGNMSKGFTKAQRDGHALGYVWATRIALGTHSSRVVAAMMPSYRAAQEVLTDATGLWSKQRGDAQWDEYFKGGMPPVLDSWVKGPTSKPNDALALYGDQRLVFTDRRTGGKLDSVIELNKDVGDTARWAAPLNGAAETLFWTVLTLGLAPGAGASNAVGSSTLGTRLLGAGKLIGVNLGVYGANKALTHYFGREHAVTRIVGAGLNFLPIFSAQKITGVTNVAAAIGMAEGQYFVQSYAVPNAFEKLGWQNHTLAMELTSVIAGSLIPIGTGEVLHARQARINNARALNLTTETPQRMPQVERALADFQSVTKNRVPTVEETANFATRLEDAAASATKTRSFTGLADQLQTEAAANVAAKKLALKDTIDSAKTLRAIKETAEGLIGAGVEPREAWIRSAGHWYDGLVQLGHPESAAAAREVLGAARILAMKDASGSYLISAEQAPLAHDLIALALHEGRTAIERGTPVDATLWSRLSSALGQLNVDPATVKLFVEQTRFDLLSTTLAARLNATPDADPRVVAKDVAENLGVPAAEQVAMIDAAARVTNPTRPAQRTGERLRDIAARDGVRFGVVVKDSEGKPTFGERVKARVRLFGLTPFYLKPEGANPHQRGVTLAAGGYEHESGGSGAELHRGGLPDGDVSESMKRDMDAIDHGGKVFEAGEEIGLRNAFAPSASVVEINEKYGLTAVGMDAPLAERVTYLEKLQAAMKQEFGDAGFMMKPHGLVASSGAFPTHEGNWSSLYNDYLTRLKPQIEATLADVQKNPQSYPPNTDPWVIVAKKFRSDAAYVGTAFDSVFKQPELTLGQQRLDIVRLKSGKPAEFRVHMIGGEAPDELAYHRYAPRREILGRIPGVGRLVLGGDAGTPADAARWVRENVLPKMNPRYARGTYGLDVMRVKNADGTFGYRLIELNPTASTGGSGFLDFETNPLVANDVYKWLYGRPPPAITGLQTFGMIVAGGTMALSYQAKADDRTSKDQLDATLASLQQRVGALAGNPTVFFSARQGTLKIEIEGADEASAQKLMTELQNDPELAAAIGRMATLGGGPVALRWL